MKIPAGAVRGGEVTAVLDIGLGRGGQVRRSAEKRGNQLRRALQNRTARGAAGNRLVDRNYLHQLLFEIFGNRTVQVSTDQRGAIGVGIEKRLELRVPLRGGIHQLRAPGVAERPDRFRHGEGFRRHSELHPERLDLLGAERFAVGGGLSFLRRRAETDPGLADDQGRTPVGTDRLGKPGVALGKVVGIGDPEHPPAVGGETGADILAEGEIGVAFNGDAVVVVEDHQFVERQRAGQRGGLGGAPLHHAAVAADHMDLVGDQTGFVQPGAGGEIPVGDRHADRRGESAAERPGGHIHSGGMSELRMSRRQTSPLPEVADLLHREAAAEEMKQRIEQHRTVSGRQHETVAAEPGRILRIKVQVLVPESESIIGTTERHPGVTGFRLLDRIRGEHPDRICSRPGLFNIVHLWKSFLFCPAELELMAKRRYFLYNLTQDPEKTSFLRKSTLL